MAKVTPKTKPVKKSVSKTKAASPRKKSAGKSKAWENLAKELKSLIPKLDEEGLAFLVKQSHVHLYNMQVDALNSTILKEKERDIASALKKKRSPAKINITNEDGEEQRFTEVKMSASGSNYYIVYNNEYITFTGKEIAAMVKIAFSEGVDLEIRERLFDWLSHERSDLLYTAEIGDKFNDKLKSLISLLKTNFHIKRK